MLCGGELYLPKPSMFKSPQNRLKPFGDGSDEQSGRQRALAHAVQTVQEGKGTDTGQRNQRDVKDDLHCAERNRRDLDDGENESLSGEGDDAGGDLTAHAETDESNADQAQCPLLPIRRIGDITDDPQRKIRYHAKYQRDRQLHKLHELILTAQDEDLQGNKHTVHENGHGADRSAA